MAPLGMCGGHVCVFGAVRGSGGAGGCCLSRGGFIGPREFPGPSCPLLKACLLPGPPPWEWGWVGSQQLRPTLFPIQGAWGTLLSLPYPIPGPCYLYLQAVSFCRVSLRAPWGRRGHLLQNGPGRWPLPAPTLKEDITSDRALLSWGHARRLPPGSPPGLHTRTRKNPHCCRRERLGPGVLSACHREPAPCDLGERVSPCTCLDTGMWGTQTFSPYKGWPLSNDRQPQCWRQRGTETVTPTRMLSPGVCEFSLSRVGVYRPPFHR